MSTIASLISLIDPSAIRPYSQGMQDVSREQIGRQQAQTGLIELARLKQSQASEEEVMAFYREHPELLVGGGSVLGSIGPAGAPPGAVPAPPPGAITQSPLGGGPAQQIPAYPDASRYANVPPTGGGPIPPDVMAQTMPQVTPPPQSTIASLGPQPQGPPQGQQHPLLELARRDPRAALMLQQQMQQSQDTAMKRQEQNLKLGAATLGYVGQQAQGVTDQASLDALRSDLQSQGLGKYAAQLPQLYSKDAMQPFIAKALDVKEALTLQVQDLTAQAALIKARKEGRSTDVDNHLRAMGVQPGQETPAQMREALQAVQQGKVDVSAAQGVGQAQQRSLGETAQKRLELYDKTGMAGQDMHTVLDEAERLMGEGVYGNSVTDQATMAAYKRGLFQDDKKAQRTARLQELGSQLVLAHGSLGSGVSAKDAEIYAKAAGNFQQAKNLEEMKQSISSMRTIGNAAIRNANAARESYEKTGKLPAFQERGNQGQGQPQGQGPLKPASQMSREEIAAEIAAIKARGGK